MRVGMVLEQPLSPVPGGTGRYAVELAAALARTARAGDTVDAFTAWHRDLGPATVEGVRGPHRLPLPHRGLIAAWERGRGPAPRDVDVVHAPTPLIPPTRRTPLVVTVHDAVPWTHPQTLTARGVRWHRAMITRAAEDAAAITVPSHAVAGELVQVVAGLDAARVHVLGAGVARVLRADPGPAVTADVHARLDLPDRYVLSLATLEPRKGLDVLIRALDQQRERVPLLVAGQPGWGGVDLAALVAETGLPSDAVRPLGRLGDRELAVVLRSATALVAPSLAEGFGLPVAEAMAAGTPVVCSDAPALVEVAGPAALIVPRGESAPLADALDRLLADADLRDVLSRAGVERAAGYDWDVVAGRAWALYRAILQA